jgi:hypothetical protein
VPDRPLVRRRTAVLGLAATVVATGCDHGDDIGGPAPSSGPSSTGASPSEPAQTPDEALVNDVTAQLVTALSVATDAWKAPQLRRSLAPLVKAHRKHIRVLDGELPPEAPPGPPPVVATALRRVRRSEKQLQAALVVAAERAESGALARLLASMSASVTQFTATLPTEVAR